MKSTLILVSLLLSSVSYAASVPAFMVGDWSQASRQAEPDTFKIGSDSSYEQVAIRQVGQEGTNIPYPTVCRYREIGTITAFDPSSNDTIAQYINAGKTAPSYTMVFSVTRVELIASASNTASCEAYVAQRNAGFAAGNP